MKGCEAKNIGQEGFEIVRVTEAWGLQKERVDLTPIMGPDVFRVNAWGTTCGDTIHLAT